MLDGKPAGQRPSWETRSRFEVEKEMAELKRLQQKLGDSLEWILEALSQEDDGEPAILRKRQALESLAYAKHVLKGSVLAIDDAKLFDETALKARENTQEATPATSQISHVSGYPPLPGTWLEAQTTVVSQAHSLERRRGLGHSSSSPSLSNPSVRLSTILPRTPWNPVSDKPTTTDSSAKSTPPKPQQLSAPSSSRPIQAETLATNPPVQHDPLGVL
jgi:TBC1 domain family member 5